jgi:hypothetical protein
VHRPNSNESGMQTARIREAVAVFEIRSSWKAPYPSCKATASIAPISAF